MSIAEIDRFCEFIISVYGESPDLQLEEMIVETVEKNPVVVVIGETGSGKSNQLLRYLIGMVTQRSGLSPLLSPNVWQQFP